MNTETANHRWSPEALFRKAQLYVEQMEKHTTNDWQFGLWSALSLEMLVRAALAHISPVLLADNKNWRNLAHALGKGRTSTDFFPRSLPTKDVLSRLKELIPNVSEEIVGFCIQHAERRNAELHSGELAFENISISMWLPNFYKSCDVFLDSMDRKLEDFVSDAVQAREIIEDFEKQAASAVEQDILMHKKAWKNKSVKDQKRATLQSMNWATRHSGHRVECPACESQALLQGSPRGAVDAEIDGDMIVQRQAMVPSSFECIACGLRISGILKLTASGFGTEFSVKRAFTAAEYFQLYTVDDLEEARNEVPDYEPDFNEY